MLLCLIRCRGALTERLRLAEIGSGARGRSACRFLHRAFQLSKAAFGKVLRRLDSIGEFTLTETGVGIKIHATNDGNQ